MTQDNIPPIFCSACGQKNASDANFCLKCGKQIISTVTTQPPSPVSPPPVAPGPERLEQKSSGIVTALAVVGFVFGLIGMLGSFVPFIGIFAIRICVGAAVISGLSVVIALAQNAKRSFPIAALTISLIGVAMIYVQIGKLQSATESMRKFTEELQNKPHSQPRQRQTENITGQQLNPQISQKIIIKDAFMSSGLDAYKNPIDKKDKFSPGQMTLYYYFGYEGAIQGNTGFYVELFYNGNNIRNGQATAPYSSGNHSFSFNADFLPGQYEVRLLSNGNLINNTYFSVIATTTVLPQQPPPPMPQPVPPMVQKTMQQQDSSNQPNFIKAINGNITKIGFFEGPRNIGTVRMDPSYRTHFNKSHTRFIWWQMQVTHPIPNRRIDYVVETKWYGPSGNFYDHNLNTWIESNWINSFFHSGYGNDYPGSFEPGEYRVDFYSQEDFLASGNFTVY